MQLDQTDLTIQHNDKFYRWYHPTHVMEMYVSYHGRPQLTDTLYEHQEEGMTLVIKAQEFFFYTIGNIHSTPINDKSQVVFRIGQPNNSLDSMETMV